VSDNRPTTQRNNVLRAMSSSVKTGSVVRTKVTFLCSFTPIRAVEEVIVAQPITSAEPLKIPDPLVGMEKKLANTR
jgi:hypothetical protein